MSLQGPHGNGFSRFFAGGDPEDPPTIYAAGSYWPPKRFERYLVDHFGIFNWLFSNPPEADYNRNDESTNVLLSYPTLKGGVIQATRFAGGR